MHILGTRAGARAGRDPGRARPGGTGPVGTRALVGPGPGPHSTHGPRVRESGSL